MVSVNIIIILLIFMTVMTGLWIYMLAAQFRGFKFKSMKAKISYPTRTLKVLALSMKMIS